MQSTLQSRPQPSITSLVSGIITDVQQLVRQEITLARVEIQQTLHKAKLAAMSFSVGGGLALAAAVMLCLMLVHLLQWLTVVDGREMLPLWSCYAIVGGVMAVTAAVLVYVGAAMPAKSMSYLHRQRKR